MYSGILDNMSKGTITDYTPNYLTAYYGTYNSETGTVESDYTNSAGNTTKIRIPAKSCGIDVSNYLGGEQKYYLRGVYIKTTDGFDYYPIYMEQLLPKTVATIADLISEVSTLNGTSLIEYYISGKVEILGVGSSEMFISDSTGVLEIKNGKDANNTNVDMAQSGYKPGDEVANLHFYMYRSVGGYADQLYGSYCSTDFPTVVSQIENPYTATTLDVLGTDEGRNTYAYKLVTVDNIIAKNNVCGNFTLNTSYFYTGEVLNVHTIYSIKALFNGSTGLYVIDATATGSTPPLVPVEVANIKAFKEANAELTSSSVSSDLYKITGKVNVIRYKNVMYVYDETAAARVTSLQSTAISSNTNLGVGSVANNLTVFCRNLNSDIQLYFDNDECTWPEPNEGEVATPILKTLDDVTADDAYYWVKLKNIAVPSTKKLTVAGLHTYSKPNDAASVTLNSNTLMASQTIKAGNYDILGVFVPTITTNGVSSWTLYATSVETAVAESDPISVENIKELQEKTSTLSVGSTSTDIYKLATVYVSGRTNNNFFAQNSIEDTTYGFSFVPATGSFSSCSYGFGAFVNGLKGKVRNNNGQLEMLIDPSELPSATLTLSSFVQETETTPEELTTNVALKNIFVTLTGVKFIKNNDVYTLSSIPAAFDLLNATDMDETDNRHYIVKGIYDGTTFHVYSADVDVKVDSINIDDDYAINGNNIEGNVEVYTLSGTRISQTNLNAGIYLIRVNGKCHKVIIK
jgi:hypothetical protein